MSHTGFGMDYDNIVLNPRVLSTVEHRSNCDTSALLGDVELRVPILGAPMADVVDTEMAWALYRNGSFGFIHRFQSIEKQAGYHESARNALSGIYENVNNKIGAAVGVVGIEESQRFNTLYENGIRYFVLDTANGATARVLKSIEDYKSRFSDIFIVAGNVSSAENFQRLSSAGADAIRVGIAGGSVCETSSQTGIRSMMASTILEIARYKERSGDKTLLIADGGIKKPADFCKAIALGADLVMCGGIFAGTGESPGPVIMMEGKKYKRLSGASSYVAQQERGREPLYVEGSETLVSYTGSLANVLTQFKQGLQSCMSYFNSYTLEEFRVNTTWEIIR